MFFQFCKSRLLNVLFIYIVSVFQRYIRGWRIDHLWNVIVYESIAHARVVHYRLVNVVSPSIDLFSSDARTKCTKRVTDKQSITCYSQLIYYYYYTVGFGVT